MTEVQQVRCQTGCANSFLQIEIDGRTSMAILGGSLSRPSRIFLREAVVFSSSLYASLIYSILFLLFAAYPYIFHGIYGMPYSTSSLAFLPMGLGVLASYFPIFSWDRYYVRKFPPTSKRQHNAEYRRLPLVCAGGHSPGHISILACMDIVSFHPLDSANVFRGHFRDGPDVDFGINF